MKSIFRFLSLLLCLLLIPSALAVEFVDANGRTVSIDNPSRVVSLYTSYGDAWQLAGGKLVGAVADSSGDSDTAKDLINLGLHTEPNMELLFSLDPDFVLLASNVPAHKDIGIVLEQAGIPCAYFSTPDWRDYMDMMRLFTQITGREDIYARQVETVQEPIEAIITAAQANESYGQSTVLLLRAYSNKVKAKDSQTSVAGNILKDMGLVNLADGESLLSENLSMEAILEADPDYICIVMIGSDSEASANSLRKMLTDNPAWSTLTAVRENRCVILDRELFHYHPNERWAESFAFIAELIKGANP